eukprot:1155548-Pelagomonas_calceolata.AAC.3
MLDENVSPAADQPDSRTVRQPLVTLCELGRDQHVEQSNTTWLKAKNPMYPNLTTRHIWLLCSFMYVWTSLCQSCLFFTLLRASA